MAKDTDTLVFLKCVPYKGSTYLHLRDVVSLLEEFAATEETDVRWRVKELCDNLIAKERTQ